MFLGRITNELKTKRQVGKLRLAKIYFIQLTQAHPGATDPGLAYRIKCHTIEAGYLLSIAVFRRNIQC